MTSDEIILVARAQSGDTAALDMLLKRIQAPLFRCIKHIVGHQELAEDILQDVFVILYRRIVWLRNLELFRPWAYRIASREAIRRAKRERRIPTVHDEKVLADVPATQPPEVLDRPLLKALSDAVLQLSPASRAVLTLHYLEEMTMPEVARVLEISLGTAKSRLAYGLKVLRQKARYTS